MDDQMAPGELGLDQWRTIRRAIGAGGHGSSWILGGTGHLRLSPTEQANAVAHLLDRVLPALVTECSLRSAIVVTGAAPGGDLLFNRTALEGLRSAGISCFSVALLPVPVEWLLHDWEQHLMSRGHAVTDDERRRGHADVSSLLMQAQWRVRLYAADTSVADLASPVWREEQYRRLAAGLVEHCDTLVAILREASAGEPGGTAEVVSWWRDPALIPLSLRSDDDRASAASRRPLIVIDPRQRCGDDGGARRDEIEQVLSRAQAAMEAGNDLHCHDLLTRALERGLRSRRLQYLQIRSLADIGGTQRALALYRGLALSTEEQTEDWLALHGRLEKDLALLPGSDPGLHYRRAAQAYADAFSRWHGAFSGVNAATCLQLAGEPAAAHAIATEVARQLAIKPLTGEGDVERYFHHASAAEAAINLGDAAAAAGHLHAADAYCRGDVLRRSRTRRQLRRLGDHLALDPSFIGELRLPEVLLLDRRGDDAAEASTLHFDFAIEAGTLVFFRLLDQLDLLVAETLLARETRLYPVLPCAPAEAISGWRRRAGPAIADRLATVLAAAQRAASTPGYLPAEDAWCAAHVQAAALGASKLTAQRLGCGWHRAVASKAGAVLCYQLAGADPVVAEQAAAPETSRRMVGILFADFAGFSRVAEAQMPRFWHEAMVAMGASLERHGARVLCSATWGDALHVVCSDAATTAAIALDILDSLEARRRADGAGEIAQLELRVAAHWAPAWEAHDARRGRRVFYGSQISFAARIEPVTPPGTAYGSDAFVARLMLEAPGDFAADYAGDLQLAKRHGSHPLFWLRRGGRSL